MKRIAHKTGLHVLSGFFILLGIIGMIIPGIPGIIFIIVGVYFSSLASLWLFNHIDTLNKRFPRFKKYYDIIDSKVNKYIKKAH